MLLSAISISAEPFGSTPALDVSSIELACPTAYALADP